MAKQAPAIIIAIKNSRFHIDLSVGKIHKIKNEKTSIANILFSV
jgi:hypothetical protein